MPVMLVGSVGLFLHELLHPGSLGPHGGYWFWSGIGSDITEVALLGGILTWLRHKNCVEKGCWRLGHPDPEHGQPVCRHHCVKLDI